MIFNDVHDYGPWVVSSSSDPAALRVVDGTGPFSGSGPHYSRRTPGSKTFTGVGKELVLITKSLDAVFAVVYQRTPAPRGSGASRGRSGTSVQGHYVWRNMLFRNLGETLSSELIEWATWVVYVEWRRKYGFLPAQLLRTEIDPSKIRSTNPGYCYRKAGWHSKRTVRRKLFFYAPCLTKLVLGECHCCPADEVLSREVLV